MPACPSTLKSKSGPEVSKAIAEAAKQYKTGKHSLALSLYEHLIASEEANEAVYGNAAIIYRSFGQLEKAISYLRKAIELSPDIPELHFNLGNSLAQARRFEEAIKEYQRSLELKRNFPACLFNLGNAYKADSQQEEAIAAYAKALLLDSELFEAHVNLGSLMQTQGYFPAALACFKRALSIKPNHPDTVLSLGRTYLANDQADDAVVALSRAVTLKPDSPDACFSLGNALKARGDLVGACQAYERGIEINPDVAEAYFNLGTLYSAQGHIDQAIETYRKAIARNDNLYDAHLYLGLSLLQKGLFEEGWVRYDYRLHKISEKLDYVLSNQWHPGLPCKTLLVYGEQGIGDQVMFSSLLSEVANSVDHLIVQVDQRLIPLLERSMPEMEFVDLAQKIPEERFDHCVVMGTLAKYFRSSTTDFQRSPSSFLQAQPLQVHEFRESVRSPDRVTIGISWWSSSPNKHLGKTIPIDELAAAISLPTTHLVNLQYGDVSAQLAQVKDRYGIEIFQCPSIDNYRDLDGLATLIECCDLIITTSNITVHLAGALGKTTWLLLHKFPDWRWGLEGDRALWYPSVKLFRQDTPNHWQPVLDRVRHQLDLFVRAHDEPR